jgi:hypothetical protein
MMLMLMLLHHLAKVVGANGLLFFLNLALGPLEKFFCP